jgi:hypothetical protein
VSGDSAEHLKNSFEYFYPAGGLMISKLIPKTLMLGIVVPILATRSCDDPSAQIAREAADRQAQQNTTMAELNKEVASGSHKLVEADAQARKEIVGVHRDLQAERSRLDTGWSSLEHERREIAGQRRTESTLVSATTLAGGILLVVLLVAFCRHVLPANKANDTDAELSELLISEVLSNEPPRLAANQQATSLLPTVTTRRAQHPLPRSI